MAQYDLVGRFYFKQTSNGNLIGEYSNYAALSANEPQVATESADFLGDWDDSKDKFIGAYRSSWAYDGVAVFATLTITPHKSKNKLFTLEWRGIENYEGEGMLCDDILIGDYHPVPPRQAQPNAPVSPLPST